MEWDLLVTKAFLINLDRSPERLATVAADAAGAGIELIRVPGVDGKDVPPEQRTLLDERSFLRDHGKCPLPGEYGCYASHLKALELFGASGEPFGLILEDDVHLPACLAATLEAIEAVDDWDVVKLVHHRRGAHRMVRKLNGGFGLGAAMFGPSGSAAAYLVRQSAVPKLLETLQPMSLPYDIALERGWQSGLRIRHVHPDPIGRYGLPSLTRGGQRYARQKLRPWNRLSTLRFRSLDAVRRFFDGLGR